MRFRLPFLNTKQPEPPLTNAEIDRLAHASTLLDQEAHAHAGRVADLARRTALELGIDNERAHLIGRATLLHDVGAWRVQPETLEKPGELTRQERAEVQSHVETDDILTGDHPLFRTARNIARHHHERWDGQGYPDRLYGKGIPVEARIVAVCEVYDALMQDRAYRDAWKLRHAREELQRMSESAFDPEVVSAFLRVLDQMT